MVLLTAGAQVPLIPFVDVVGNMGAGSPLQMAVTGLKVGVIGEFTVTVSVVIDAHCSAAGENV